MKAKMKTLHVDQSEGDLTHLPPASPISDGLKLTRRFRAVPPEVPVLMFTGTLPVPSHRTDNLERLAVLGKTFDLNELVRTVRTLLDAAAPLPIRKPWCCD